VDGDEAPVVTLRRWLSAVSASSSGTVLGQGRSVSRGWSRSQRRGSSRRLTPRRGRRTCSECSASSGTGAAITLAAIAQLDDGELGVLAGELLTNSQATANAPEWIEQIGESEIVSAAVISEAVFDDARTVLLESRHPDGETMAVGVLIDRNLGGLAKEVLLAESIEQVAGSIGRHTADDEAELELRRVGPGVAAGLIRDAIARTDMTWGRRAIQVSLLPGNRCGPLPARRPTSADSYHSSRRLKVAKVIVRLEGLAMSEAIVR
jgi:hypothetical protein